VKRLGVVGTMVWDTIYGRGAEARPVEEWGGIAYALAALEASLPEEWCVVPLIKVGSDLASRANRFLNTFSRRAGADRFVEVATPNNRVTLHYDGLIRSSERLSGGVPPWTWTELEAMVGDLDALYVNFISGFELSLDTARRLRGGFPGPIYADLHSLFLSVGVDGLRKPEPLDELAGWLSCFDVVQLNEDEMALAGRDPMEVAARAMAAGVRLLIVTLGARGAAYFVAPPFAFAHRPTPDVDVPIRTARVPAEPVRDPLDPTGCGDVFGATIVSMLAAGSAVEDAIARANALAARNLTYRGATALHQHLRGEIVRS